MAFCCSRGALFSCLAALVLGASASAQPAAGADLYARSGWYLGLGGHAALENFDGGNYRNSGGLDALAGYRFTPHFAIEGQLDWNDDFADRGRYSGTCNTSQGPRPCVGDKTIDVLTVTANAKGFLPLGRVQPFALLGGGVMRSSDGAFQTLARGDTDAGYVARFGAGVDLYATRRMLLSLGAAYVLPTGATSDLHYVSIGGNLQFRF